MEEGRGSGDRGSDVIKRKSSSGCLIIKKKVNGVSGFGGSGSRNSFELRNEKKRSRLVLTDSGSSDEVVEPVRRKVREDIIYERRRSGIEDSRMLGFERKRGGIDVFEFDEYNGFDGKKMRMDDMDDRLKLVGRSGDYQGFEFGSSRNVVFNGRKSFNNESIGSMSVGKSKGTNYNYSGMGRYEEEDDDDDESDLPNESKGIISAGKSKRPNYSGKSKYEEEDDDDDEPHPPISIFREKRHDAANESIRLQGKNGVLKVMVNKKKKRGFPPNGFDYPRADERMSSRSEAAVKKNKVIRPSFYSDSKQPEKPIPFQTEKNNLNPQKGFPILSCKAEVSDSDDSEKSLKQEIKSEQVLRSKKTMDDEHKRTTPTESLTPPRGGKESKVKRGNGTEKQLLREKIRSMLLGRGWKIDYRPRRNRDYLDAVYINPAGTAYWSIIKAYDALQKQLEEEEDNVKPCDESTSFTPLPEEIISKLTRQTRKKIERELKKKKRDALCSRNAKEVARRDSATCTDSEQQEDKLSYNRKHNHKSLRSRLPEAEHVSGNDSSGCLYQVKEKKDMAEIQSATNSHMIQGRKSRKIGRCTLLVRSSDKGLNSAADGYVPYTGKRTILSWLVDSGIVHMSEKVQYMNGKKTRVMLEGWITKDGIHCCCCSKILTISKFEIHAGSKQRQPFLNIYLQSGMSLMQCQIDAWNKQEESEREGFHYIDVDGDDPNDDTCGLCGDGGDLICCDSCPSTFHQSCLDIKMLPTGDWHCPNCTCKFCGCACWSNAKADNRTDSSLFMCSLCEKKYHQSCSEDEINLSVNSGDGANLFCGKNCQEIFSHLQKLLGVKHELESGFSWSLVHRMDQASEKLQLGFPQRVECNSKLAVALSVMDECFLPIVDRRSGINLIHNVLYNCGSNFSRLNYSGFYTALLEKGDEIISAASIRIHGMQLAEMPFIGTRHIYRRQGMCRRLLSAIESALGTLKVEKLITPAIAEHMHTWTGKFNFSPLTKCHKQEMRSMNMLVFPGTDMLQKLLVKREITGGSTTNNPGLQSTKANENSSTSPLLGVSEPDSSPKHDHNISESTDLLPLTESRSKANASLSASHIPTIPSNGIPAISGSVVSSCKIKHEPAAEKTPDINSILLNNSTDSTVSLKSTSPSNEHLSTFVAQKAVLGQSAEYHTQSSVEGVIALEVSAKAASVEPISDSVRETSDGIIEEDDATVLQKSVPVRDSVSCGTSEPTLVEYNMRKDTAVDLNNTCKVCVNGTSANSPQDFVEQSCAKDKVEEDTLLETSNVNIEEDATVIRNSVDIHDYVSHITSQNRYIDSTMSTHSGVDLNDPCEVPINETPVILLKDSAEQPYAIAGSSKGDAIAIRNSVSVHDPVPLGACKSTHIDSYMTNQTAVDLYNSFEVNLNNIFVSSMEEDATVTQNSESVHDSVSFGACESTHIDSDMTNLTAVELESGCEVNVNDTFVISPEDSAELLSSKDIVEYDTLSETIGSTIEVDATDIPNYVSLHDSVSLGAHENTHIDSDMTNLTALNLDNNCEVNVNDSFVNFHINSAEQLSSKDIVEDDTLREASSGTVKEDATAILNSVSVNDSVSLGARESTHIDSDMTCPTAVDLDNSSEINVNDTFISFPEDPAEQLSSKDIVEDDSLCETIVGTIKNYSSAIQNSVSVQDSVSLCACESTQVDYDMTNLTAVDLDNSCEVNVNGNFVNSHKDSVEQLLSKDIVEDDTSREAFCGTIKEDVIAIQNSVCVHDSVSLGACESTHIDCDMTNPTAVDLDNNCEVNVNATSVSHKDSAKQLSPKHFVEDDTICETFSGAIKEDVISIENSVSVHNPVSLVACESTHIHSDMTNSIAVDLENDCEVNINDDSSNSPKVSVEQLSAKDNVKDGSLCETSTGNIEEDSNAIQNSVSHDTFASTYTDSDMGKHTAVGLENTCEVNMNDTCVISSKDSVEKSSTENAVKEDVNGSGTITQYNTHNVVDGAHEV